MAPEEIAINDEVRDIPILNAWYMLLYAWDLAEWKGHFQAETNPSHSLLGLLASILAESVERLIRRQLRRSHEPHHEIIRGIRGRIDFATCIKKRTFEKGAASCRYSDLSVDTLKNRIILATLQKLARDNRIAFRDNIESANSLRQHIHLLIREMQGVSATSVNLTDFSRLQLTRSDQDYFLPLTICSMIHRLEMPMESSGDHALVSLLRHEIKFSTLFERFLRNFYRLHLQDYEVASENLKWPIADPCQFMPEMKTDITLKRKTDNRRITIDAKYYKSLFVTNRYETEKFRSGHLYQLYAYLRTQEENGLEYQDASGMLIYPTVREDIYEAVQVQGHKLSVASVNLNATWENIESCLLELVG